MNYKQVTMKFYSNYTQAMNEILIDIFENTVILNVYRTF